MTDSNRGSGASQRNHRWTRWALAGLLGLLTVTVLLIAIEYLPNRLDATTLPSTSTPKGVALRYFMLQGAGRGEETTSLLAPELPPGGQVREWIGLKNLHADDPVSVEAFPGKMHSYKELERVYVSFSQVWSGPTSGRGPHSEFVTIGRKSASEPWKIIAFGFY